MRQIQWYQVELPDEDFEDELIGVYSCYSVVNRTQYEMSQEVYIYIRHGVLYKKTIDIQGIKWYMQSAYDEKI